MPNQTIWVEPELFLYEEGPRGGVHVFHTYKDNDVDQGQNFYRYVLEPLDTSDTDSFDIRDLGYTGAWMDWGAAYAFLIEQVKAGNLVPPEED